MSALRTPEHIVHFACDRMRAIKIIRFEHAEKFFRVSFFFNIQHFGKRQPAPTNAERGGDIVFSVIQNGRNFIPIIHIFIPQFFDWCSGYY